MATRHLLVESAADISARDIPSTCTIWPACPDFNFPSAINCKAYSLVKAPLLANAFQSAVVMVLLEAISPFSAFVSVR